MIQQGSLRELFIPYLPYIIVISRKYCQLFFSCMSSSTFLYFCIYIPFLFQTEYELAGLAHSCSQHAGRGECHFFTFLPFEGKAVILYTKSTSVAVFKDFLACCLNLVLKILKCQLFLHKSCLSLNCKNFKQFADSI